MQKSNHCWKMNEKCDQCRVLIFREPDRDIPALRAVQGSQRLIHVLHETRESWMRAIARGCHFCALVRGQVYDSVVSSPVCDALDAFVILAITHWPESGNSLRSSDLRVQIISRLGNSQLSAIEDLPDHYLSALDDHISLSRCRSFGVQYRDHSLGSISHTRQSEGSLFNAQLARLWRDECLLNHTQCQRGSNGRTPKPPTRLVDVADPEHPFIREVRTLSTSRPDTQYVALSYCWGMGKRFLALKENYEIFKTAGIPSVDLPRTFKEAIYAAHRMGYQYIWIDALCIIQDDSNDMENELRYMGDIYRYAELTICAQGAASSYSGLFQSSRHPLSLTPCSVDLRIVSSSQETTVLNRTLASSLAVKDYLISRGWILQEEILTLRALKFSDQMSWRCMEAIQMETEPHVSRLFPRSHAGLYKDSNGPMPLFMDPLQTFRSFLYTYGQPLIMDESAFLTRKPAINQGRTPYSPDSLSDIFAAWYSMVGIYSYMELTFSSDVLRALSGLSGMFCDSYKTTYLAGLWKEDLFAGLCWYVSVNDNRPVAIPGLESRPGASNVATGTPKVTLRHTVPSWTWASVGKVRVRFACLSTRATYTKCQSKPRDNNQYILDAFCSLDDPINQKRPVLPSSSGNVKVPGQLWSLRMKTKVKKAVLRRSDAYTNWRIQNRTFAASSGRNEEFESLKTAPGIYPRFPGQLLDFEDRTIVLGEVACDFGLEGNLPTTASPTADHGNHNELVKWHASSASWEKTGSAEYQDLEMMCLLLDAYRLWPDWYDLCLIVLPRAKGSTSFVRIGLGFLPRGENHEDGVGSGWGEMDCEIF